MSNSTSKIGRFLRAITLMTVFALELIAFTFAPIAASAHGERNQEPFLRMRTAHFYDVKWSTTEIPVNGEIVVTGKFRLFPDWPISLPLPDAAFLGNGTPGPVLVRTESYINGVPAIQSSKLELNRDYDFKIVMKGRLPGTHHVHPLLNIKGGGPLLGPGNWLTVTGDASDFALPVTAISGEVIENLETWGIGRVYGWYALWIVIALGWLGWWLRRPLLMPRYRALTEGGDRSLLVTNTDRIVGAGLAVLTILIVYWGVVSAQSTFANVIPPQGSRAVVVPVPEAPAPVRAVLTRGTYDVPGRSMKLDVTMTNSGPDPVQLGEFLTSNLRFINHDVPQAVAAVDPDYPKELIPPSGLKLSDGSPLQPGETRDLSIEATDVAWETERLASLVKDPDNTLGALLFFYDSEGNRTISTLSGPLVPVYTDLGQSVEAGH